jgi:hypothetical protein
VQRDDRCEIAVKGNDAGRWRSKGVVLWLGRGCKREMWLSGGESAKIEMILL